MLQTAAKAPARSPDLLGTWYKEMASRDIKSVVSHNEGANP
jgi:hypothetical protein